MFPFKKTTLYGPRCPAANLEELPDDQRDDERDMLDDFPEDRLEARRVRH